MSLKENALEFREQHRQAAKCKCEAVEALLVGHRGVSLNPMTPSLRLTKATRTCNNPTQSQKNVSQCPPLNTLKTLTSSRN
jgi:hypothetical protein